MRVMVANEFEGYRSLHLAERELPVAKEGEILVKLVAAGVTPLEHTILSGHFPHAKAPLILGSEGSGVIDADGDPDFPRGANVMFAGMYGVAQDGAYSEWLAVRKEHLRRIPAGVDAIAAGGLPIAYLTAQLALKKAGFAPGKSVLAPAIGGSVGNAAVQLARAQGATHAISTTSSSAKAKQAADAGFTEVIDLSQETIRDGVTRITQGKGVDVIIDGIGGDVLSAALGSLALAGTAVTLGYSAGRKSTIDVTDLIWKRASLQGFSLFSYTPKEVQTAWDEMEPLFASSSVRPIVSRTFPLADAAEAIRYLVEDRPFGRVLLTMS
jgi:NADPH2:quinone reductase